MSPICWDRFSEPDRDPNWGRDDAEGRMGRYDYGAMNNRELAARMRQYRRNRKGYRCEFGHHDCGCTNAPAMNGIAPCSQEVQAEISRRTAPPDGRLSRALNTLLTYDAE